MEAVLRAAGLVRTYRGLGGAVVRAVDGLSFTVHRGEAVALIGPNGSGKSTTLRLCAGLEAPGAGTVTVFDRPPASLGARRRLGYLPEEAALFPFLTGVETLDLRARLLGWPRRERRRTVVAWLERVGLAQAGRRRVATYSRGMARRLSLALACLGEPELLLLDEPTGGLDPEGAALALSLLREQAARGGAALFTTHLLEDLVAADRWLRLEAGRLAGTGRGGRGREGERLIVAGLSPALRARLARAAARAGAVVWPGPPAEGGDEPHR